MRRTLVLPFAALVLVPCAAWPQGNPVGPEFRVNTYTTNGQAAPAVASDTSGNFVVVWGGFGVDDPGLFGQRYASSGMPLGPEFRVNAYTGYGEGAPAIASDAAGNFVVVWFSKEYTIPPSGLGVFGQRYARSGTPLGPEFRVNTSTIGLSAVPSVSADSAGNFVVAWDTPFGQLDVFGQRYDSTGNPLGGEFRINAYTPGIQRWPSMAADSSGNFVVVWQSGASQDGSDYGVFGQHYASSGAPLGPEFRANTFTPSNQVFPSVAADPLGNFVVVWESYAQDGSANGVFGQRYDSSGTPLGPEFRVNTYTTGGQSGPSVAADSSGNFVVVWTTQDGSSFGVFGQRYDSSGAPLGPEFRVNTYITGTQHSPSIATDSLGNFVVAWTSDLQDGSSYGVFGQRYNMIVPVELMHFRVE